MRRDGNGEVVEVMMSCQCVHLNRSNGSNRKYLLIQWGRGRDIFGHRNPILLECIHRENESLDRW